MSRQAVRDFATAAVVFVVCLAGVKAFERVYPPCPGSSEMLRRENRASAASERGDHDEALRLYGAEVADAERCGKRERAVYVLGYVGVTHLRRGREDEAEAAYRRRVELAERVHGPARPYMLGPLADLTLVLMRRGRLEEAASVNERALRIVAEAGAGEHGHAARLNELLAEDIRARRAGGAETDGPGARTR